jgi:transcriptional regulator with XRE-family HTH domain
VTALAFDTAADSTPQLRQDAPHGEIRPKAPQYTCVRFATALGQFRRRAGLSQNALAAYCQVNASYINRIESGERNRPTVEVVASFARALRLSQRESDLLLASAGYLPSYGDDVTVRQLAVLLADSPAPVVATLRAQISAAYRVLAAGQEGAGK